MLLQLAQVRRYQLFRCFARSMPRDMPHARCKLRLAVTGGIAVHASRNGHCSGHSQYVILLNASEDFCVAAAENTCTASVDADKGNHNAQEKLSCANT